MPATQFADNRSDEGLRVSEQHQVVIQIIEWVIDARETRAHAALDDHYGVRLIDIENGHAVDRARGVGAGGRIGNVVGADHQSDVRLREVAVDLLHFYKAVIRNIRFG